MTEKSWDEQRFQDIEYNLKTVREALARAAEDSGRTAADIELMAVTKTVEERFINHAIDCGVTLIGENRVQELLRKKPNLRLAGVRKNLIGHLQTNKVAQIVGEVDMIESVDSLKVAREIGKQSLKKGVVTDVLVEVNIGLEASKTGLSPEETPERIAEMAEIAGLHICGLMSVPPICEDRAKLCKYFENMYNMYVDIGAKKIDNVSMNVLSMGMSGDFAEAVRAGSNHVRVGSRIFGPRVY